MMNYVKEHICIEFLRNDNIYVKSENTLLTPKIKRIYSPSTLEMIRATRRSFWDPLSEKVRKFDFSEISDFLTDRPRRTIFINFRWLQLYPLVPKQNYTSRYKELGTDSISGFWHMDFEISTRFGCPGWDLAGGPSWPVFPPRGIT